MNLYEQLENMYPISKTLKFSLLPIGKTRENITNDNILNNDYEIKDSYEEVKKCCDEYHKLFINQVMKDFNLANLNDYAQIFYKNEISVEERKKMNEMEMDYCIKISNSFTKSELYKKLFSKDMVKILLPKMYANDSKMLNYIKKFEQFYTYFNAYNLNRGNIYKDDLKHSTIAYRIIKENLPIFLTNIKTYDKMKAVFSKQNYDDIQKSFSEYLPVKSLADLFVINYYNYTLNQDGIDTYNLFINGKTDEDSKTKLKGLNEYINLYNQNNKDNKIPKFKTLYKQILSDQNQLSFVLEKYTNDAEMINEINNYYSTTLEAINKNVILLNNIEKYDLQKIYISTNNLVLTNISNILFNNWNTISEAISIDYDNNNTNKKTTKKYLKQKKDFLNNRKYISLYDLNNIIKNYNNSGDNKIIEYFKNHINNEDHSNFEESIINNYELFNKIRCENNSKNLIKSEADITIIKAALDAVKKFQEFIKRIIKINFF